MSRSYCFTLNNYTMADLEAISLFQSNFRYLIFGAETAPSTGTKHLQGYFELAKPQRISWFKDGPLGKAHLEVRKGPREKARDYCKKDGDFYEFGNWKAGGQGTRNDLKEVMNSIKSGTKILKVMELYPETYSHNLKFCEKYASLLEKENTKGFRNVDVQVIWGDAGTGKTKAAHDFDKDIFTVNPSDSFPFDGYDGETSILIDDFYGDGFKYSYFLRVLDGHQLRIPVKGGHRYANWNKIFITSNAPPSEWYTRGLTPALARRINGVRHMKKDNERDVTRFCNEEPGNTDTGSDLDFGLSFD